MKYLLLLTLLFNFSCANKKIAESKFMDVAEVRPLLNGAETNGEIVLKQTDGISIKFSEIISKKPTVLVFYRGGWCPYCTRQLSGLRKIEKQIKKYGYQLVAISPDNPINLKQTLGKQGLKYQLYSDQDLDLALSFGLAFRVDPVTLVKYKEYGIDLVKASGKEHRSLPVPAVYILDKKGKVHFNYVNPDYKQRLNEQILLSAIKELRL